ncbi:MAG: DUF47 family protein [Eggerthellaceae bacterium]
MGKKHRFDYFDAFENQAGIAVKEAQLLVETIKNFTTAEGLEAAMEKAHQLEHEGDEVNHSIYTAVATDFMPPIEREDILGLAQYLDEIIDYIEDVMQRFYMYDVHTMHHAAGEFAAIMLKSCEALEMAMGDFRNFKKSKKFKNLLIDVNTYEEEADLLFLKTLRHLHTDDKENPMRVIVWSQLYERMEKCCDACEHTADMMNSILLKNV